MVAEETRTSRESEHSADLRLPSPITQKDPKPTVPAAIYIAVWIGLSSSVIVFNKWILDRQNFRFPIFLTTWHLVFSTIMTQILARFTSLVDPTKVRMTGHMYLRAIIPIGIFFSLSLMFSNMGYLYLSVSFIQMLKATTPVATLLATWGLGIHPPNLKTLGNVTAIVVGVVIASLGELKFHLLGFVFVMLGVVCEATRLAMVERLLNGAEYKMDPLLSLYYFAPVCAVMNGVVAMFLEYPYITMDQILRIGPTTFLLNASVAFCLNLSVVFLIGRTSALVLTLSGVLKDILLVVASMVIFLDPVSLLQAFGYSIALAGLVYYKLGADKLKVYFEDIQRGWKEYGIRRPIMRMAIILCLILATTFAVFGKGAPSFSLHNSFDEMASAGT